MSSDTCKLSDIADVQGGFAFKSADFSDTGVAVVKIANIQPPSVSLTNVDRIAPDKLQGLERFELLDGDILMAMTGATVGKAGRFRLTEPAYLNQRVARISAKKGPLFDDFVYAVVSLPGFDNLIEGASAGSAQANISAAGIGSVVIPKLSDSEQIQIGGIARMLDDRIALLRETNATLEAIAQALFKSWFVDFDPVHARARGEQPAGLSPEVAALFPDSFEESELGMVPKGWMVEPLDEIADFLNGLALQKFPPDGDADLPVIKIAQLRKGDAVGADRASSKIKPEYIIQSGDVLFSWSGSLEVEVWCGGEGALNQHLFKVTSQRFQKWFYLHWTKHHLANFKHIAASKATTMGHIQRRHLTEAMVVVPSPEVIVEADKVFAPLLEQWINNALQAQTLATLRDTLLPRLISGQLRLPEAEVTLQEAGI
ncbi:restriction endonuclease subunit S [Aeromonas caviae]|uniref:restriction endonuclease subunit S n=1 Tax=Aeromonas caviae TaxID=648 RepID=UPI0023AAC029|nr:restriction endonuclease subunit S [Aeromonas caviae]WEE21417.1 restriction endonuclease subunit S [Aeromonas caviae]